MCRSRAGSPGASSASMPAGWSSRGGRPRSTAPPSTGSTAARAPSSRRRSGERRARAVNRAAAWRPPSALPYRWMGPVLWLGLGLFLAWNALSLEVDAARIARGLARAGTVFARAVPPDFTRWPLLLEGIVESIQMATLSTALGTLLGVPVAAMAARNVAPLPVY